jgi:hypothetical protein
MHFFSGSKEEITVQAVTAAMEAVKICMGGIPYDADQHKVSKTSKKNKIK